MPEDSGEATVDVYGIICLLIYTGLYKVGLKPIVVNASGSLAAQMPELAPLLILIPEFFDILSPDPIALLLHVLICIIVYRQLFLRQQY